MRLAPSSGEAAVAGTLPGGLWKRGASRKGFALRPRTGALELELADAARASASVPAAVTAVLARALLHLDGEAPSPDSLRALCVVDRQFLLRRLQVHLGLGQGWHQALCGSCGQPFDFALDLEALPVVPAGPGYPFATVELADQELRFRLPVGGDQEAIAEDPLDESAAAWALLRRCWVKGPRGAARPRWADIQALGAPALDSIEQAMEAVAPAMTTEVDAACPQCASRNGVAVDTCEVLRLDPDALLREVHALAMCYRWSEAAILELPPVRRQHYLRLIDESRGLVQ